MLLFLPKTCLVYCLRCLEVGYLRTWRIDASEENPGDRQRNTEVDHPPRVHLEIGQRTVLEVGTPITVHCAASRKHVVLIPQNADLIGRQVSGYAAHLVSIRWTQSNKIAQEHNS